MRVRVGILALALGLATGLAVVPAATASAAVACPSVSGVTTIRWTGHAGNGLWVDRRNWSPRQVPGVATDTPTDYACIPATGDVTLRAGEEADLQALDSRGSLHLTPGAKLFVGSRLGATDAPAARINNLDLVGATLGGTATVTVTGTFNWTSVPPDKASTQTTRKLESIKGGPPAFVGRTVIAAGAVMNIDGGTTTDGGVNLRDDRALDVLGSVVVANGGFLAADWGTTVRLLPDGARPGRLTFENDGGVYQGFTSTKLHWETDRATLVNAGLITKQPGAAAGSSTGTTVIDAAYSGDDGMGHSGSITVKSGTITVFGRSATATVNRGTAVGFGGCPDAAGPSLCREPTTDAADPQTATYALAAAGTAAAVGVALGAPLTVNPYNRVLVGDPVVVTAPAQPTASVLTLRVDASITGGAALRQMTVGLDGGVLPACSASAAPCVLTKKFASDGSGAVLLTVATTHGGTFSPLGPRFR